MTCISLLPEQATALNQGRLSREGQSTNLFNLAFTRQILFKKWKQIIRRPRSNPPRQKKAPFGRISNEFYT